MKFLLKERQIRNGYLTAFGLLMVSYFLVFFIIYRMEKRQDHVGHTNVILNNLDNLLAAIKDSETQFRNFIVLHDSSFLSPYRKKINDAASYVKTIRALTQGDSIQKIHLDSLEAHIRKNMLLTRFTFSQIIVNGTDKNTLVHYVDLSSKQLANINATVQKMQERENQFLNERTKAFEQISQTLKIVHFTTFIIALLIAVYSLIVFNNVSIAKHQYRAQLEEGIEKLKSANNDLINLRTMEKFAASGRIARAIAHEVRNPLTSISLATEQLNSAVNNNDDTNFLLNIISRNVTRIHNLILELLNSTRFAQLELITVSLNSVVEQALELANDRIELDGIVVKKNYSPDPCMVEVDFEKIKIAFLNLIINAVEAMAPGGILELATIRKKEKCELIIKDNGIGIHENVLGKIFDPYYTQKENGNGLGLTLTQNIVLNHRGNISVESKPGEGTTFSITLNHAGAETVS